MKKRPRALRTVAMFFVTALCVLFALIVVTGMYVEQPRYHSPRATPPQTHKPTPSVPQDLWERNLQAVLDTITQYPLVRSATIERRGSELELKLVINPIATDDHARELGDNFVRITKSLLDEGRPPSKRIGPGNYDYHITVIWWPDQVFDRGVKLADDHDLRW